MVEFTLSREEVEYIDQNTRIGRHERVVMRAWENGKQIVIAGNMTEAVFRSFRKARDYGAWRGWKEGNSGRTVPKSTGSS